MKRVFQAAAAVLMVGAAVLSSPAHAEGTIRIAEQYGIAYLPRLLQATGLVNDHLTGCPRNDAVAALAAQAADKSQG